MAAQQIYRTADARFADLPGYSFAPHYVETGEVRLHHLDEGEGNPVLMIHGEPTWSYLYRRMIEPLTVAGHRVIVPDLPGFGRSDKPTDIGWYTYDRHCEAMTALVESLDLRAATVVVQDWGGPIGLRLAVEMPDRFERLVIMNTGLFAGQTNEAFLNWRNFAERAGLDLPIEMIIQGATAQTVPDEVLAAYAAPFPVREARAGAAAFPLLVPITPESPGVATMRGVLDALGAWDRPVLVMFSDSDPIFPPRAGQRFCDHIPGAEELVVVEGAAHFLQEDRGEVLAGHIVEFLARNPVPAAG
ncbi:MAG: haloalkane dehalogenase [Candidatus Dormibacteria bacterium]